MQHISFGGIDSFVPEYLSYFGHLVHPPMIATLTVAETEKRHGAWLVSVWHPFLNFE